MPSLLFIDHIYHKATRSTLFLQEILKTQYDITTFYWDPYTTHRHPLRLLKGKFYDLVVCFQILPRRRDLDSSVTFRRGVFFPMFDAIPPLHHPQWYEYRDFQIINFCKFLYEKLCQMGFSAHYIQYFPKYEPAFPFGDAKSAFFWQRRQEINFPLLEFLLSQSDVNHIHWHTVPDPKQRVSRPSKEWETRVSHSNWFTAKQNLYAAMAKSALYIAPRMQEGIGQSFLEAMAMGRCVIAPDFPTMNEYIKHGETGFLYSLKNPEPLHLSDVFRIQINTAAYMQDGYDVWKKKRENILQWIEESPIIDNQKLKIFYNHTCKKFSLLGIPLGVMYSQNGEWKYVWPHIKIKLCFILKNKKKFFIRILGIPIIRVKRN